METKDEKMSKAKYNIVTLSAESLIDSYGKKVDDKSKNAEICYEFDFRNVRERSALIKSTETLDDTALFYQIREVMGTNGETVDENALCETLYYVDFEQLFNEKYMQDSGEEDAKKSDEDDAKKSGKKAAKKEDKTVKRKADKKILTDTYSMDQLDGFALEYPELRIKALIEKGFTIQYEGGRKITYQVFDKSNSMSRHSKISFIDSNVAAAVSERLNLGICFNEIAVTLSKYYAYRGLYLTTADRVECADLKLNADTVVVIKDSFQKGEKQKIVTAGLEKDGYWKVETKENEPVDIKKVFDGEGLISPRYAALINESLGNMEDKASSFQVRMPFMKGMLHTVDFHAFIKDEGKITGESFLITDAYGMKRDLMKAEIIVPVSMFKCFEWLKEYAKIKKWKEQEDIMKYYFEKFSDYNHALYIGNTDLIYGKSSFTRLSYQFLNTLDLTADELDKLVQAHAKRAKKPEETFKVLKETDEEETNTDAVVSDEETVRKKEDEVWSYTLRHNPVVAHEPGVKTHLEQLSNGLKLDIARGRFLVKGEVRFLSRDLLGFLIELLKKGEVSSEIISELIRKRLHNNKFFMPANKIALEVKRDYPIFRSPHLSRNEQCALKPYYVGKDKQKNDIYYKYFGKLRGVLMVAYNSLVPDTLSGADFDGDIVKVIDNESVRNAVLRGVYKNHQRELPIIVIPSDENLKDVKVSEKIPYDVVKNTFSNKVGQISNLSIRIGNVEYAKRSDKLEHSCAECTILTGLEIDAAKTGKHPKLDKIIKYAKNLEAEFDFDYIRDFKSLIDDIGEERYFISKNSIETDGDCYYAITPRKDDPKSRKEYVYSEKLRGINRLPKYFFDAVLDGIELPGEKEGNRYIYFEFLRDKAWKKSVDTELQEKVAAVISAYRKVAALDSKANRMRTYLDKSRFEGHIKTILRYQYDAKEFAEMVRNDLYMLWTYVDELFDKNQQNEGNKFITVLEENNWPFLLDGQKEQILNEVFGWDEQKEPISNDTTEAAKSMTIKKMLTNFDIAGYNILYYALMDVGSMRRTRQNFEALFKEDEEVSAGCNDGKQQMDSGLFAKMYKDLHRIFVDGQEQKKSGVKKELMELCKEELSKLLENISTEEKVKLLYSLRGSDQPDSGSRFFWECVTTEDIKAVMGTVDTKGE